MKLSVEEFLKRLSHADTVFINDMYPCRSWYLDESAPADEVLVHFAWEDDKGWEGSELDLTRQNIQDHCSVDERGTIYCIGTDGVDITLDLYRNVRVTGAEGEND